MALLSVRIFLFISFITQFCNTTNGFKIDFWLGERCTSAEEGSRNENYTPHGKCYSIPTNAQSATVHKQSIDKAVDVVAFYMGSHCKHRQATTNDGCIDFTGTGHNAGSFRILRNGHTKRDFNNDVIKSNRTSSSVASSTIITSDPDPYGQIEAGFGHGNVTELWGDTYKWWQAAPGVMFGIPLDEWDEETHAMNCEPLSVNKSEEVNLDVDLGDRNLEKRLNMEYCTRALKTCARASTTALWTISQYWGQAARKAAELVPIGHKFYDWCHKHPFSVGITTTGGGTIAGYGLGKTSGGATAQDNDQLGFCATKVGKEVEGLIEAVQRAGVSGDASASVDITLKDTNILQVHAAVFEKGHKPADGLCEA